MQYRLRTQPSCRPIVQLAATASRAALRAVANAIAAPSLDPAPAAIDRGTGL